MTRRQYEGKHRWAGPKHRKPQPAHSPLEDLFATVVLPARDPWAGAPLFANDEAWVGAA